MMMRATRTHDLSATDERIYEKRLITVGVTTEYGTRSTGVQTASSRSMSYTEWASIVKRKVIPTCRIALLHIEAREHLSEIVAETSQRTLVVVGERQVHSIEGRFKGISSNVLLRIRQDEIDRLQSLGKRNAGSTIRLAARSDFSVARNNDAVEVRVSLHVDDRVGIGEDTDLLVCKYRYNKEQRQKWSHGSASILRWQRDMSDCSVFLSYEVCYPAKAVYPLTLWMGNLLLPLPHV